MIKGIVDGNKFVGYMALSVGLMGAITVDLEDASGFIVKMLPLLFLLIGSFLLSCKDVKR